MVTLFCFTLERVDTLLKLSNRTEIVRYICQKLRQKARALTGSVSVADLDLTRTYVHFEICFDAILFIIARIYSQSN